MLNSIKSFVGIAKEPNQAKLNRLNQKPKQLNRINLKLNLKPNLKLNTKSLSNEPTYTREEFRELSETYSDLDKSPDSILITFLAKQLYVAYEILSKTNNPDISMEISTILHNQIELVNNEDVKKKLTGYNTYLKTYVSDKTMDAAEYDILLKRFNEMIIENNTNIISAYTDLNNKLTDRTRKLQETIKAIGISGGKHKKRKTYKRKYR